MTCSVKPDDPRLQTWIDEGLSIEVHTIDHPCPLLNGEQKTEGQNERDDVSTAEGKTKGAEVPSLASDPSPLSRSKSTYDRCVVLLNRIPGNSPVAFRMPCCNSLNTVSPRFYSEIFNGTSPEARHLDTRRAKVGCLRSNHRLRVRQRHGRQPAETVDGLTSSDSQCARNGNVERVPDVEARRD